MFPFYLLFIFLTKSWSRTGAWICAPLKTPALIFSNDKAGGIKAMFWKHSLLVFNSLTNCFIRPSLMGIGGKMIFSGLKTGSLIIFEIQTSTVSSKDHSFWFQCSSPARLSHMQIKQGNFVNPLCWSRRKLILSSTQIVQFCSWYFICPYAPLVNPQNDQLAQLHRHCHYVVESTSGSV